MAFTLLVILQFSFSLSILYLRFIFIDTFYMAFHFKNIPQFTYSSIHKHLDRFLLFQLLKAMLQWTFLGFSFLCSFMYKTFCLPYMLKSGIAGYTCILNVIRCCQIVLQSGCTNLHVSSILHHFINTLLDIIYKP